MANAKKGVTLSAPRLRACIYYHPSSGDVVSLMGNYVGKRIGVRSRWARINIDGVDYSAARLVWLYVTGAWPSNEVGYRNGDRHDLRWNNLFDGAKVKHGAAPWLGKETPEYRTWKDMRARCSNPKNKRYHRYGGRGITICERWNEFANFLADMGSRPPLMTLDRKDNDGNYEPGNCRWATSKEQARTNYQLRPLTAFSETLPLSEWAAKAGMARSTLRKRLDAGMSVTAALTKSADRSRMIDALGERLSISEWAQRLGTTPTVIGYRLRKGWSAERAVSERVGKTGEWQAREVVMERNLITWR